jgi:hypothetical protein
MTFQSARSQGGENQEEDRGKSIGSPALHRPASFFDVH